MADKCSQNTAHLNDETANPVRTHIDSDTLTVKSRDLLHQVKGSTKLLFIHITLWFFFKPKDNQIYLRNLI